MSRDWLTADEKMEILADKLRHVRNQTIEECARVADSFFEKTPWASEFAAAIRAIKNDPYSEKMGTAIRALKENQ